MFQTWVQFARLVVDNPGEKAEELLEQIKNKSYDVFYRLSCETVFNPKK